MAEGQTPDIIESKRSIGVVEQETFANLQGLKLRLLKDQEANKSSKDPLSGADKNLAFINKSILPLVIDYMGLAGVEYIHIAGDRASREYESRDEIFLTKEALRANYWATEMYHPMDEIVTPKLLKEMYNESSLGKSSVKVLGKMSGVKIIDKIQSELGKVERKRTHGKNPFKKIYDGFIADADEIGIDATNRFLAPFEKQRIIKTARLEEPILQKLRDTGYL